MAAPSTATPTTADLDTTRDMLLLSMLSYRAYHDLRPGEVQLAHLEDAVDAGLTELERLHGRWDLVWGPAAYRAPFTFFDENVLYVVRQRQAEDHKSLPRNIAERAIEDQRDYHHLLRRRRNLWPSCV